jgi:hypothetical protein
MAIKRSGVLNEQRAWLVALALVVMAAARFVSLGAAQYVIGVAGLLALTPLARCGSGRRLNSKDSRDRLRPSDGAGERIRRVVAFASELRLAPSPVR